MPFTEAISAPGRLGSGMIITPVCSRPAIGGAGTMCYTLRYPAERPGNSGGCSGPSDCPSVLVEDMEFAPRDENHVTLAAASHQ